MDFRPEKGIRTKRNVDVLNYIIENLRIKNYNESDIRDYFKTQYFNIKNNMSKIQRHGSKDAKDTADRRRGRMRTKKKNMRKYVTANYTLLQKLYKKDPPNDIFPTIQELYAIFEYPQYVLNEEVSDEEDTSDEKKILIKKNEFLSDYPLINEIFAFVEQQVNKAATFTRKNETNPNEEEEIIDSDDNNDEIEDPNEENAQETHDNHREDEKLIELLRRFHK